MCCIKKYIPVFFFSFIRIIIAHKLRNYSLDVYIKNFLKKSWKNLLIPRVLASSRKTRKPDKFTT